MFAKQLKDLSLNKDDILVSYDVTSLFTNVLLDFTIDLLVDKAFTDNWFSTTYELNISSENLSDLLKVATKDQLFQFNGNLYQQTDGVAMGSPVGSLLADAFLCYVEETLEHQKKLPNFYRMYVDDTLAIMRNVAEAEEFLTTLNNCHPSIRFTMEVAENDALPFLGMLLMKQGNQIVTSVYRKSTNKSCSYIIRVMWIIVTRNPFSSQCYTERITFPQRPRFSTRNVRTSNQFFTSYSILLN